VSNDCTNVVTYCDDVTQAIDSFICNTSSNDNVTVTSSEASVRCTPVEQPVCFPVTDDQQQAA
jgi:predicted hydrocarbon binding protein